MAIRKGFSRSTSLHRESLLALGGGSLLVVLLAARVALANACGFPALSAQVL
jgi:hypothetical protein